MMTRNPFPYKNDENKENFASSENKTVRRHKSLMNVKKILKLFKFISLKPLYIIILKFEI